MSPQDSSNRLLMIDDDVKLCRLISSYLTPLGYDVSVAHTGPEGLDRALHEPFSAILLDVMLPGLNGFDLLRELRQHSHVPVLMLTALGEEADRIVGLEMGADDYLPKTFSTRELLARLRAVLRRSAVTARLTGSAAAKAPCGWRTLDRCGGAKRRSGGQAAHAHPGRFRPFGGPGTRPWPRAHP